MRSGILPPKKRWREMAAQASTTQTQTKKARSDIVIASHLFAPVVQTQEKNPLRTALEQHFALMNDGSIKTFHFSQVLKEIAFYHRDQHKTLKKDQKDVFSIILFLYEKAVIIDPNNPYAK